MAAIVISFDGVGRATQSIEATHQLADLLDDLRRVARQHFSVKPRSSSHTAADRVRAEITLGSTFRM